MNKKDKRTIVLNLNDYEWMKLIDNERIGCLFLSLYKKYRGEKYEVTPDIIIPFNVICLSIDEYNERWWAECKRRNEVRKKANKSLKAVDVDMENDKDMGKDILKIKKIFLFEKGCFCVNKEYERFVAHYEKSGWLDGNGVQITNRLACAKCWKPQYKDDIERNNALGYAKCWKSLFDLLARKEGCELLVTDVYGINFRYNKVRIDVSRPLWDFLQANYDENVEAVLKTLGSAIEWNVYEKK
ncbi:MAG: hypothetical protein IJ911_03785 [Salinivirgaceae bacterium]|nr:hypothetical protein [Salinivirgaceae bacterium]